jgi:hypothetical protein
MANTFISAQTDIKPVSDNPSADDFLAREKAILGEDANQFSAYAEDADGEDDLLGGGGGGGGGGGSFESQFPDIMGGSNQVWWLHDLSTVCFS